MISGSRSLMDFVDAPVLVGDPDGRAVYANPAFERDFSTSKDTLTGVPLASLFEGGAREAVLAAVAGICTGSARERFRLREAGRGFEAMASPVEVEGGRVGVVILLFEEANDEGLQAFRREVQEPLDELTHCLVAFSSQTGDRRDQKYRVMIAEALRAIERMRKWSDAVATDLGPNRGERD
ncbi:MAG: PAS domain-containing protein [Myxococcota bacterium]